MPTLALIVIFSLATSFLGLAGGILLLFSERLAAETSRTLTAFAAGVLLATGLLDLVPEAAEGIGIRNAAAALLGGMVAFCLLERLIRSVHYHSREDENAPSTALIVIGDTAHNFLDGVVVAAAFMTSTRLGIVTAAAVAAHEIPQEIADFAVLLRNGLPRRRVLFLNVASAIAMLVGAFVAYGAGSGNARIVSPLLGMTAGFFVYVAAADLIPDLQRARGSALRQTSLLLAGIAAVVALGAMSAH